MRTACKTPWAAVLLASACHATDPAPDVALDAPLDATSPMDVAVPHDAPDDPLSEPPIDAGGLPFPQGVYRATHNSYSGDVDGMKGPIATQLDRGVRFIELDIHTDEYASTHDFQIGHDTIGMAVDHSGGNPASNALHDWLGVVATWSASHPTHAPITVMFDLKSNLSAVPSYAAGDFAALDDEFAAAFGSRLLRADALGPSWPTIDALRGRVMVLLSGDPTSRARYRRELGRDPAVGINAHGDVVEVHDDGSGTIWSWTGALGDDGRVRWRRRERIDAGRTPAVAIDEAGSVVEVDQAADTSGTLRVHTGKLGADGDIAWSTGVAFANGSLPSVRFTTGATVREVHRASSGDGLEGWDGAVDDATGALAFDPSSHGATSDPRFDTATADAPGGLHVTVYAMADGPTPANTLRYSTATFTGGRIRYEQLAFVEYQYNDAPELADGAWYYAAPAAQEGFIRSARMAGRIARGWDFDSVLLRTTPLANYPASNTPYASWYTSMMDAAGAVQ